MSSEAKENAKRAMRELFGGTVDDTSIQMKEVTFDEPDVAEAADVLQAPQKIEVTKIGGDTVITGSVRSSGALEIRGTIYGDVTSDDDVYLYGRVAGDIGCRNFYHYAGAVKGNITAAEHIEIEGSGAILGDLKAANVRSDGRVSGNISATGKVELLEDAIVVGDINTKYFTMKDSACLHGVVHLESSERKVDAAFSECFNF